MTATSLASRAVEDAALAAAAQHHDAVRQAKHFLEVGADHDHRHAGLREVGDDIVDRRARADVDAARRLVQDEHAAAAAAIHLAITTFCWLPPDSFADRAGPAVPLTPSLAMPSSANSCTARRPDPAARRDMVEIAERDVLADRLVEHDALRLAVLRHQHDAGARSRRPGR